MYIIIVFTYILRALHVGQTRKKYWRESGKNVNWFSRRTFNASVSMTVGKFRIGFFGFFFLLAIRNHKLVIIMQPVPDQQLNAHFDT